MRQIALVNLFCTVTLFPRTEARLAGCLEALAHVPLQPWLCNDRNDLCYAPLSGRNPYHWAVFLHAIS